MVTIRAGKRHDLESHNGSHSIIHVTRGEIEVDIDATLNILSMGGTVSVPVGTLLRVRGRVDASYVEVCSNIPEELMSLGRTS